MELLYYAYHIMVGLGFLFILVMGIAALLLWRGRLETSRPMLWVLMLAFPFPYIATTMGWLTAELGRQPWLVYGLQRTVHGLPKVSGGNVAFTTLGFMGLYLVLGLLFLYLVMREVTRGPQRLGGEHGEERAGAPGRSDAPGRPDPAENRRGDGDRLVLPAGGDAHDLRRAGRLRLRGGDPAPGGGPHRPRAADGLGAIGPLWDGNEVWLIAAGGLLVFAFPRLLGGVQRLLHAADDDPSGS